MSTTLLRCVAGGLLELGDRGAALPWLKEVLVVSLVCVHNRHPQAGLRFVLFVLFCFVCSFVSVSGSGREGRARGGRVTPPRGPEDPQLPGHAAAVGESRRPEDGGWACCTWGRRYGSPATSAGT